MSLSHPESLTDHTANRPRCTQKTSQHSLWGVMQACKQQCVVCWAWAAKLVLSIRRVPFVWTSLLQDLGLKPLANLVSSVRRVPSVSKHINPLRACQVRKLVTSPAVKHNFTSLLSHCSGDKAKVCVCERVRAYMCVSVCVRPCMCV